jgi:hypothetical protein
MFQYSYIADSLGTGAFSVWVRRDGFYHEIARVADEVDAKELVWTLEALDCTGASRQVGDNA